MPAYMLSVVQQWSYQNPSKVCPLYVLRNLLSSRKVMPSMSVCTSKPLNLKCFVIRHKWILHFSELYPLAFHKALANNHQSMCKTQ